MKPTGGRVQWPYWLIPYGSCHTESARVDIPHAKPLDNRRKFVEI